MSQRLAHERGLVARELARAQSAERRAEVTSQFLMDTMTMFGREITSREILEQSLAHMRSELSAPGRKEYVEAEKHYREALALYDRALPADSNSLASAQLTMLGRHYLDLGQPQEAEATLKLALERWSADDGPGTVWYAQARAILGRTLAVQRKFAEAEPALIETYPLLVQAGLDELFAASVRGWIEDLYRETGRQQQAQAYFQQLQALPPTAQK
jgi:tetratricopeptide (TPR) repeat protein